MSVLPAVQPTGEVTVNTMGPLMHIYLGMPFLGKSAMCGHRCPKDSPETREYDPSRRHCVARVDVAARMGWTA